MTYTPKTWVNGDIIHDYDMNHIENGIASLETIATPEMFGAVGDGVTDDTSAWQDAIDSGYYIEAKPVTYKCGQLNITKDIIINFNGASFICTGTKLFNCAGSVKASLTGESDYTANASGYTITGTGYTTYNGVAFVKGTNNFEKARSEYVGGFVAEFWGGKMTSTYPITVTTVSIDIITPIRVVFKNIGNIKHPSANASNASIYIEYGKDCVIEANMNDTNAYNVISFNKCINCIVQNSYISQEYATGNNNSYLVSITDSSYCKVKDSIMYNKNWHCVSTGGIYLCYKNIISNCSLSSDAQMAYWDHENATGTIIKGCVVTSAGLAAMGTIEDTVIISNKASTKMCQLHFIGSSIQRNAVYNARNVQLYADSTVNNSYIGVFLYGSPSSSGNTYYFQSVTLDNVKSMGTDNARFNYSCASGSTYVLNDVLINDSNLLVHGVPAAGTQYTITNYELRLTNIATKLGTGVYPTLYGNNEKYNTVILTNCHLNGMLGTYEKLVINNVTIPSAISNITVTTELFGNNVDFKLMPAVLLNPTYVKISDMKVGNLDYWFNIATGNDNKKYYQKYIAGVMTTTEITS